MTALRNLLFAPLLSACLSAAVSGAIATYQVLALGKCDPKFGCTTGAQFAVAWAVVASLVTALIVCAFLYSFSRMVSPIRDRVFYGLAGVIGFASAFWATSYARSY